MNSENGTDRTGIFSELMPMLGERTILITVAKLDDNTLCVNFIPKQAKAGENEALTTPLCVTGSPEELDRDLVAQVRGYAASHVTLSSTLADVQREMDEAAKKAREDARKKNGKGVSSGKTDGKTVETKAESPAVTSPMMSLFDHAAESAATPDATGPEAEEEVGG
jgi:PRTRC genetic system protein E